MYDEDDYYNYDYSDYYTESEESTYESEDEHNSEDFEENLPENTIDETIVDDTIVYTEWKMIHIDNTTLRVSNTGKVQYTDVSIFLITKGLKEPGTPYRFVFINGNKYYVHDLIWRAFNEQDPAPGFEVRHENAPLDDEGCYLNELRYIDIFENNIQTRYRLATISA